ncbi:hypothetical protein [Microscilla marina]|nr:hypothetical protein [Microscilla marina]
MKTPHPSHLQNLEHDIQWLAQVIQARYDFLQGGKTQQVSYVPVRFQVKTPEGDRLFKVEHPAVHLQAPVKEVVIPVYQENKEDLIKVPQGKKEYFAVLKVAATVHLIALDADNDWAQVWVPNQDNAYLIDQNLIVQGTNQQGLQGWVKLSDTNIPSGYHPDLTEEEFNKAKKDWAPELQTLITANIPLRKSYLQWQDFYNNQNVLAVTVPEPVAKDSVYGTFIEDNKLTLPDRLLLILLLLPHLQPGKLEEMLKDKFSSLDIGNTYNPDYPGIIPNGLMFIFLLAGNHIERRLEVVNFMMQDSVLLNQGIIQMEQDSPSSPLMSGRLRLHPDYVKQFVLNQS